MLQSRPISGRPLSGRVIDGRALGARSTSSGGGSGLPTNAELREDGSFELREDGSYELREDIAAAAAAPTLTLTSGATDNQPDFLISGDLLVDDVVTVSAYSDVGKTTLVDTGQGTVTVAGSLTITNQLGPLSDAPYWYDAITSRAGISDSAQSNTANNTIDATPPTLSSPTGVKTGATTASLSVSTDEGNGTVFWVVDTNTTTPSAAQVKLGKDQGGNAADDSGSQAVSTTGVQTISGGADGLTGSTTYKAFYMHEDAVGNQSTVSAQSGTFTTDAGSSVVTFDAKASAEAVATGTTVTNNNLTIGTLTKGALIAAVVCESAGNITSVSVTWNGVPMTQLAQAASAPAQVLLFGLRNPGSGNHALVASWTGTAQVALTGVSFDGVNQTSDAAAFTNANTATGTNSGASSVTITSAANNMIAACHSVASGANITAVSGTSLFINNGGSQCDSAANYDTGAAPSVAMTATIASSSNWAAAGVNLAHA